MQKVALVVESVAIMLLLSLVLWQRYERRLKKWWKSWRAKSKRAWTLRPRTPADCRVSAGTHHSLRVPMGQGRYRGRTPAMSLGVTGHIWSIQEFSTHPLY
jgi:hypothetical protein